MLRSLCLYFLYKLYLAITRTHGQDKSLISTVLCLFRSPAQAVLAAIPPTTGPVSDTVRPITLHSASRRSYYTDYSSVSSVISFTKNTTRETIQYYILKQVCLNTFTNNYTPLIEGPLINSPK